MAFLFLNSLANSLFGGRNIGFSQDKGPGLFGRATQDLTTQDLLSGGFSSISALAQIAAGGAERAAAERQAEFAELNAAQIGIRGREAGNEILQDVERNVSNAIVAAAASGVTAGGSVGTGIRESIGRAEDAVRSSRDNAIIGGQLEHLRARELRRAGRDAQNALRIKAFGQIGEAAIKIDERRRDRKERRLSGA